MDYKGPEELFEMKKEVMATLVISVIGSVLVLVLGVYLVYLALKHDLMVVNDQDNVKPQTVMVKKNELSESESR